MLFICSISKKNHVFQLFIVQVCSLGAMAKASYYNGRRMEKYGLLQCLQPDQHASLPPHLELMENPKNSVGTF